ncbi:MAG: SDR family NAD(P)-dependent oxidoreductase [Deltaproteobacteria bacterium]|nr:SDR family NAD(P)-dependent oxidoreductase [Deltaproteobacteria bacterium]
MIFSLGKKTFFAAGALGAGMLLSKRKNAGDVNNLQGDKAIVTGGAMGFGFCICKRLVREGVEVTIWDLNEEAMAKAKQELESMGGKIYTYKCDVSDRKRVEELCAQAKKDMGRVDILINNAGFFRPGVFHERPVEEAVRQMEVNMHAHFYTTHAVLPDMIARNHGYVVNVSSSAAFIGGLGWSTYCSSKSAVHGFTDVLRTEMLCLGKKGVKFISVHPGQVKTGMFEGVNLGIVGKLAPPMESHDTVAEGIVEDGLKRDKTIICRPKTMYIMWMIRGWVPNKILDRLVGLPSKDSLTAYRGRPGMAHTDPEAEKKAKAATA